MASATVQEQQEHPVLKGLRVLFRHQALCDASLVCQGEVIKAHKVVLMCHSRLLCAKILLSDSVIFSLDIGDNSADAPYTPSAIKKIVAFMYHGEFEDGLVGSFEVQEMYRTASYLQVDAAIEYLKPLIDSNQCDIYLNDSKQTFTLSTERDEVQWIFNDIFNGEKSELCMSAGNEKFPLLSPSTLGLTTEELDTLEQKSCEEPQTFENCIGLDVNEDSACQEHGVNTNSPRQEMQDSIYELDSRVMDNEVQNEEQIADAPNSDNHEINRPKRKVKRPRKIQLEEKQKLLKEAATDLLETVDEVEFEKCLRIMPNRPFDVHKQNNGLYQCPECTYTNSKYNIFSRHIKSHRGARPYHCTVCEKTFTCAKHLRAHQRTHSGEF